MNIDGLSIKYNALSEPVRASFWYIICNVLNKGISLISTPIFTRILTEEQYGTFAIFQSWYGIILIFTSLNIFLGGYTKGLLLYRDNRDAFTSSLLALTTLLTCIFGIIYLVDAKFWSNVFEIPSGLMLVMFIELLIMPAFEFWSAQERFDFKYQKYVLVSIAMTVLSLVTGVIAVIYASNKVYARITTDAGVRLVFAVIIYVIIMNRGKKIYSREYWIYSLKFNLPLIPHYLSNSVLNQSDRIMIGKMVGNSQAAFYSIAYTISTMMTLITVAINNSLTPYIYKTIDNGNSKNIKEVTKPLFLLVAALCILTMAFAPEIIFIFAGKQYAEAIYVIPPIATSVFFIFLYSMFSTIEYFYQKTAFIAFATCISAVLNLILNYFFISLFGYYAAGYTTLICYMCLALMHYIFYKKTLKEKIPDIVNIYDIGLILIIAIVLIVIMLLMVVTYKNALLRYGIIAVLSTLTIVKKEFIISILSSLKSFK